MKDPIENLMQCDAFADRHIGADFDQQQSMLNTLGFESLESMLDQIVPDAIRKQSPLSIPSALSEHAALAKIKKMASQNQVFKSFIGLGFHNTHTPPVIQRNLLENPAWYTAYTPYQAEISQGRMEAMLNFQTMVCDLTGMELANASMLDEATACAEAMTLCQRMSKSKGKVFFVAENCHPQNIEVVKTRAEPLGIEIIIGHPNSDLSQYDLFGMLLQYPATDGLVMDYSEIINKVHDQKALVAMSADLLALTLLKSPGEMNADVAIGNTQRFGIPLGFGGPHAAYMATKDAFKRSMPGRLIGVSVDRYGNKAYRLALQTREQHIRREKATSNICTAQALLASMASMYATYHGPDGLKRIAKRVLTYTQVFGLGLQKLGINLHHQAGFDTLAIEVSDPDLILTKALELGYNLRKHQQMLICAFDETTTPQDIEALWQAFSESVSFTSQSIFEQLNSVAVCLPRQTDFMTNDVFHRYHSETEMMRYLRYLSDQDLALDRAMIPLGSCTMKLNAAAELMPVSWTEFSGIHPYAPLTQVQGYQQLLLDLEQMLCAATGYDAMSLQPNSGAQGEYAGLLAIRAYHRSRGDAHRNICLIPASAHGTNPASAQMAGMKVIVVKTSESGDIDLTDLQAKCDQHQNDLAAIMITYPSTHGVFETGVKKVCELVHEQGGQVYIDGANMNAMIGVASPGKFGGDVSHLNLHKTFAIPHGGGGPGVGPIGVVEHLAPFLPKTPLNQSPVGLVSASPWGSAGILPISWMYIAMMGREGLLAATANAILNANYIAHRLATHYPILYTDPAGYVAHECIIDIRPIKQSSGISVDDIAKRLIDYGFHAPTMSFPVAGTLMIEPTESESKIELDRFCDAMIQIKQEILKVQQGEWNDQDNPLVNAPHTAMEVTSSDWTHPYSREDAAFPMESLRHRKYWAPVGRVDNVYGDRNLICACAPISDYETEREGSK